MARARARASQPIQMGTESRWARSVAVGGGHSCRDRRCRCAPRVAWGGLDYGPVGLPGAYRRKRRRRSTACGGRSRAGWYASHGVAEDGTLWRWHDYRLEDHPSQPFEATGATRCREVAHGSRPGLDGVFGVREDGTLAYVQFEASEGDAESAAIPTGRRSPLAIIRARSSATARCGAGGRNDMGQLGIGTSSRRHSGSDGDQSDSRTGPRWTAGYSSSCGVYDRQVYCWGANHGRRDRDRDAVRSRDSHARAESASS